MLVHVDDIRRLEVTEDSSRKDGFEGIPKIGPKLRITWNGMELK